MGCNVLHNRTLSRIYKLQKRAVRVICNAPFLATSKPLFNQLQLLSIFELYQLRLAMFMYSCHKEILPSSLTRYFSFNYETHSYFTRSSNDFYIPFVRTTTSQNTIYYAGPKLWNSLPASLKSSCSLNVFKMQFKERLLQNGPFL